MKKPIFWIAAGVVFGVWFCKVVLEPSPFWIGIGGDGELVCYFNSLAIATGHRPPSVLHPGTPLQLLGAILIKIFHVGSGNIQLFLNIGHVIGLLATLGALALLASLMAQEIPLLVGTAVLLSYFLHPSSWLQLTQWESYLFHLSLTAAGLWGVWHNLKQIEHPNVLQVMGAGLIIGLACSVHLILMPLIPAGIIALTIGAFGAKSAASTDSIVSRFFARVLSSLWLLVSVLNILFFWKLKSSGGLYVGPSEKFLWVFVFGNLLGAFLDLGIFWSMPLGGSNPWSRILKINWKYLSGIATGWAVGTFGVLDRLFNRWYPHGKLNPDYAASSSWNGLRQNITAFIHRAPEWTVLLVLTTLLLLCALFRANRLQGKNRTHPVHVLGMGFALLSSLSLSVFLAIRQGNFQLYQQTDGVALRYSLPSAAIATFILAWLASFYPVLSRRFKRGLFLLSLGILVLLGGVTSRDIVLHLQRIQAGLREKQTVDALLLRLETRLGRKPYVLMQGLARPSCALRWGNSNADSLFDEALDQLYPEEREIDYRTRNAVVPRSSHPLDFIFMRESEIPTLDGMFGGSMKNWLTRAGTIERVTDGVTAPFVVVSVSHANSS